MSNKPKALANDECVALRAEQKAETERLRKANGTLFAGIRLHQQENTTIAAERDALKTELVGAERRIANQRSTIDVMTYRSLTLKAEVERLSQLIIMAQGAIDPGKHPKLFAVLTPAKETDNG